MQDHFSTLTSLSTSAANPNQYYSLTELKSRGYEQICSLPVSIRIILESLLRNCDEETIFPEDIEALANWNSQSPSPREIPFVVSRILLQDFTGVPLLVDMAAMREAVSKLGSDPSIIEPLVPVDLVVDHSIQVDSAGSEDSFHKNLVLEFKRNRERYEFLKWGRQAFETFSVIPPAIGIVHQVNLEYLAKVVFSKNIGNSTLLYPDSLVGTDSHTTMINGLGVVGWGVGGIEAEAGMLGQPVYFKTPEVIGVNLAGGISEGVTATDLALRITEMLREENVVGKFVEFHGQGAAALSLADRATIANMAPEYGATIGFFPIDEFTLDYLRTTGRSEEAIDTIRTYLQAQGLFGMPLSGELNYTKVLDLNLSSIVPSVSGPKRPQDRIDVETLKSRFSSLLSTPVGEGGFGLSPSQRSITEQQDSESSDDCIGHGSVLIAAITSCTNTSNPSVMIAAGLLAKKAVEKGLRIDKSVKTSLAPGSRVVTDYLVATGLQSHLDKLGFHLVGYGCTTCIGNSGPLDPEIESAIQESDLVTASVLSGNRNFEARVHGSIKANFLMSPPLVVAYALAGTVEIDLTEEPLGIDTDGNSVYLRDLWPTSEEINACVAEGLKPRMFTEKYGSLDDANPEWNEIQAPTGDLFSWDEQSTYVQHPPFFKDFSKEISPISPLANLRPLALLGDSVTTDHISPAGAIPSDGPAGKYLLQNGVESSDFNSFGSRRGNDKVMVRGTFANVRIKNHMAQGKEGGHTMLQPDGVVMPIHDACNEYLARGEDLIVFGGKDYGMGSSRDWAAKGTALLGVKAVVAKSFERIHRSNLLGMGVLPLEFTDGDDWNSLGFNGTETFSLPDLNDEISPGQFLDLLVSKQDGTESKIRLKSRADTGIEIQYYRHGGILPFVLRKLLNES